MRLVLAAALGLVVGARPAHAGLALSITSPGTDLTHIPVGQTVTFHVDLSGLGTSPVSLQILAATVTFEQSLLGTATTLTPGPIVPDTSPSAFDLAEVVNPNGVFGLYFVPPFSSSLNIAEDGTFYSFSVLAQTAGSGTIGFSASTAGTRAVDQDFNRIDSTSGLTLTGLDYTVVPAAGAVPEPSTLVGSTLGIALALGYAWRRRRARAAA